MDGVGDLDQRGLDQSGVVVAEATGRDGRLYIASDTGAVYRWDGSAYVVMGGYTAGDGISIEGNEISNTHTHLTSEEIEEICV